MLGAALLALVPAVQVPSAPPEKIPVLLFTGANNHDWEWTSASLETILEESGRFDVTVTEEPEETLLNPRALAAFDVFVLDYNRRQRWSKPAEKNFLDAVRGGTGVTVVHAANNAFEGWIEYEKLVALCWRRGTGHGKFHPFDVRMVDRDHPITRALPDLRAHPDELYHNLVHMHGTDYRVLAAAHSSKESGGTGRAEPMVIVKTYGQGRVFHTPLGHVWTGQEATRASHADPQFRNLIVRGTEWAATGEVTDGLAKPNHLEEWDVRAGWKLLFDGETTTGWKRHGGDAFPAKGWSVVDGCLRHATGGGGGDIVTTELYQDFELAFEWKVGVGANGGVKYRVPPRDEPGAMLGPEYQILDDATAGVASAHKHAAAALYDVIAPIEKALSTSAEFQLVTPVEKRLAPLGRFNHGRIVARGGTLEHYLNGQRVVRVDFDGAWDAAIAKSKFAGVGGFGAARPGHVGLQDHGDEVWYRSIKIRDLANLPGRDVAIFDGETLAGWRAIGDAVWSVEEGAIFGRVGGGGQSFLVTEETFGDFFLEVELKIDAGNSGLQVRSHVEEGRLHGYQLEIDRSDRAWSGGLYDEGRRGWLQSLEHNEPGRRAFRRDSWNRYRIECVGPSIRCWVNGVPTADFVDRADAEGVIGLQVHSGADCRVRWRNLRLRVLD